MMALKYRLGILILFFICSVVYFLPNIYGESPAIVLKTSKHIDSLFIDDFNRMLDVEKVKYKKMFYENGNFIIKFYSTTDQFKVYEILNSKNLPARMYLSMLDNNPSFLKKINATAMKLGLDLVGGVHLLLKINIKDKVKEISEFHIHYIRDYMKYKEKAFKVTKSLNYNYYKLIFKNKEDRMLAFYFIKNNITVFNIVEAKSNFLKLTIKKDMCLNLKSELIDKTIDILSKRIYELGIGNFILKKNGLNKISIELPGVQNVNYIKSMISKTSNLRFMMVNDIRYSKNKQLKKNDYLNSIDLYTEKGGSVLIENKEVLSGRSVISAISSTGNFLKPSISITIKKSEVKGFTNLTKYNVGNSMAIVYTENVIVNGRERPKDVVVNIARIMETLGENFQITGLTLQESKDLALLLRAGSLPSSIFVIEERVVGPTLGEENIKYGLTIIILSVICIIIFLLIKYRMLGVIASISLILNILLIGALMSIVNVVLTLPSLAGIALTVGLSIDANVLIFERIKEESKINKNYIENGFKNAFSSIFDSNLTTLIIGLVLAMFATGPIQGFAITLSIGIFTSFYSAIFVTRVLIDCFKVIKI